MNKKEEIRSLLRDVGRELEEKLHLSEEDLMAYHRRKVEEFERERIQSHVVQCEMCRQTFKAVKEFLDSEAEKKTLSEQALDQRWQVFRQRIIQAEATVAWNQRLRTFWLQLRAGIRPGSVLVAASLVMAISAGIFAFWLWQENQQLARQWQGERQEWSKQQAELERQQRHLQEQAQALEQEYESELAERRQPELNAPTYDLFSRDFITKSGHHNEVNRIKIPPATRHFILILNGEGQPDYRNYALEIRNRQGEVVWRGEGLRRNMFGNFTVGLSRTLLSEGQYQLTLYGQQGRRWSKIADYLLVVD